MSRACWSSNNIYRKQFLGCLLVEGGRALSESSRRVQDGGTQGAEEKTGAIATLEGPEFLRFKQEHDASAFWKQKSVVYIEVLD
ncbi:unnamed protein product [Sphagnum jensenii]|uniref:Uncharacterized protein n=1 Tax=Sphagnum jensenii TaxID=128206 RepID=A0ABP1BJ18_9BRYO